MSRSRSDTDLSPDKRGDLAISPGYDFSDKIRDYWRSKGYDISVGVRRVSEKNRSGSGAFSYSAVRSDLVNGLAWGYRGDLARKIER